MIVTLEKVTTPAQAEELRRLRNQCAAQMTGNPGLTITRDAQRLFFWSQITTGRIKVLLLRYGGKAAAYGLLRTGHDGRLWMSCGVATEARGKGLGTAIVRAVTEWGHDLSCPGEPVMLDVWQDNWVARRVYARAGYKYAGERVRDGRVLETWEHAA